ncbi:hypothetical protein [Pelistega ratti]|uniref:hypothetical protein n=1 Tax=Pelistega ratti TaxID=2652177 RepID=UPI00135C4398|nr:hypothetical protein [Pelistega ratti]
MENKELLGWGIVGTPKGRQQSSAGIDKQIHFAKNFDLDQRYGECLLSPSKEDSPLYCLLSRQIGDTHILGIAEYYSIYEQGQKRAGTYFGAFVEVVNAIFSSDKENIQNNLLGTLYELNKYQFNNFIDEKAKEYIESIVGKTVPDIPELNRLASELQRLPSQYISKKQEKDLYIYCEQNELSNVLKIIFQTGLYQLYKHILFSESTHISNKMKEKKVDWVSSSQLQKLSFFTEPYKEEISSLYEHINSLNEGKQEIEEKYKEVIDNQELIISEKVEERLKVYIEQATMTKTEADKKIKEANDIKEFADFGLTILDKVREKASQLGNAYETVSQLPYAHNDIEQVIKSELSSISKSIHNLNSKLDKYSPEIVIASEEENQKNYQLWILTISGISALFILILLILMGFGILPNSSLSDKVYDDLNKKSEKITQLEKQLEEEKQKTKGFTQAEVDQRVEIAIHNFCQEFKGNDKTSCQKIKKSK